MIMPCPPEVRLMPGDTIEFTNGHTVEIVGTNDDRMDCYDVTVDGTERVWHIDEFEKRINTCGGATIELQERM